MQPGENTAPGGGTPDPNQPTSADSGTSLQAALPAPATESQPDPTPQSGWTYTSDPVQSNQVPNPPPVPTVSPVSWTASEYIAHQKSTGWFLLVGAAVTGVGAVLYFITKELISPIVMGLVGISFCIFAARQPKLLEYSVDGIGLHIGAKFYPYQLFRSFSILEEGSVRSILLMPLQRFGLPITLYYDQENEDKIVTVLGTHLPHEARQAAPIDRLMSKIRF